jgi:pimeloyl-ACP methyl ester carboxylesterase
LAERGVRLEVPDLAEGDFEHLTLTAQLRLIERLTHGEAAVLVGSSLGGYLAALFAARHAEVERVVLLAPAFCFARGWRERTGAEAMERWRESGRLPVFHYGAGAARDLGYQLIEDAGQYEDYPEFAQPALILHGAQDTVVPLELSQTFAEQHPNVRLRVLNSGHELTDVLDELWAETSGFLGGA